MVLFPHAKINLGLQVIKKRHDGLHNIVSCIYPIGWCDILEIIVGAELSFTGSGLEIPGDPNDNLCLQAYHLLKESFDLPPVHMHLHKAIPIGAGLGGGSSDAAFTLKGLRELFDLPLADFELERYASDLGSDCPFFIGDQAAIATGIGDQLERIELDLSDLYLLVVTPPVHVNTGEAYGMLTPKKAEHDLKSHLRRPPAEWTKLVINDFEGPIFAKDPLISDIKEKMLAKGAIYSSLSGSGSSVYGIFEESLEVAQWFPEDHLIWTQELG
jgi:4-diphosphocytidyl-2-C-methyl-D-erythritol kinase